MPTTMPARAVSTTKVKEEKKERIVASRFALQDPPPDWLEFSITERPDLDPIKIFVGFRDYWIAKPGKDGTKLDWFATWRNWIRNQKSTAGAQNAKTWKSEGDRVVEIYRKRAADERERQGKAGGDGGPALLLSEGLREDTGHDRQPD
jgi:hypothetical protein